MAVLRRSRYSGLAFPDGTPATKVFDGRRFRATDIQPTKRKADVAATWFREQGKVARVVRYSLATWGRTYVYVVFTAGAQA